MSQADDGGMKYQIYGTDAESADEKIAKYTGEVPWSYLLPHCLKGNLLWVDPSLELAEVARALVRDDSLAVATWLGCGDLVRVGELHAAQWAESRERFQAVVVTPFVLFRESHLG